MGGSIYSHHPETTKRKLLQFAVVATLAMWRIASAFMQAPIVDTWNVGDYRAVDQSHHCAQRAGFAEDNA
ncbi:hypothetical protein [Burkholderia oklahomensis]|uniref:Uncharacterized protein n=1 Tax=Burkholderia oklahomensis TaxID=342113 RepID=A0AAI8FLM4_9BURK|nr:hypothetical protein [Burkholderia oklahomensis]AIO65164.1 hypothetical protein DM82_3025 [Burkholderia oklahomensis]AOI40905.1 hypothetical protein WG70_14205 [Burkholderia oklahomensis EO147]KUY51128.1 hypothetical protein WG70_17335 [Burkholderia oklahomensis EO147]QPS38991.1 hypothetical protein I6G57_09440 [Burkholderia oklahomensis]